MAKIIITRKDTVLQEVELAEGRQTIGRHPDSDIVIAHRAVSALHAAITTLPGGHAFIEDLNSTNGTWVDGERIARRPLGHGDRITVAKFEIEFSTTPAVAPVVLVGGIEVSNGPNAGKRLLLTKPVSTLGRPGIQVVAIMRQDSGYFVQQTGGDSPALLNGAELGKTAFLLSPGDVIDVAGTAMQFFLQENA